ncbi:MAG: hypothetical protein HY291_21875 [Planctomycetes bacterium]|nr:hypothetical protein [Planctomycetota bacterium]
MAARRGSKNAGKRPSSVKRGRKAIFTPAQKNVLERMIRSSLKGELKTLVKSL